VRRYAEKIHMSIANDSKKFAQAHRADTMAEFQGLLLALEQGC
jgi:hypothetical protein